MRPIIQTLTAGGTLQIPLDMYQRPFNVTIDVIVNGAGTYGVQASNDDPFNGPFPPVNFMASAAPGLGNFAAIAPGATTNQQADVSTPVRQLYFTVSAGSATIRVMQAGAV